MDNDEARKWRKKEETLERKNQKRDKLSDTTNETKETAKGRMSR